MRDHLGRKIAQPGNPLLLIAVFPAGTHTDQSRIWHEGHDRFIKRLATLASVHTVLKVLIALLPWWITCVSTTSLKLALARWKPPWLMLLLLGHIVGCLLVLPYSNWLTGLYEVRWPALEMGGEFALTFSNEFWMYLLRAGAIWIGINFVFDRFVGLPL